MAGGSSPGRLQGASGGEGCMAGDQQALQMSQGDCVCGEEWR